MTCNNDSDCTAIGVIQCTPAQTPKCSRGQCFCKTGTCKFNLLNKVLLIIYLVFNAESANYQPHNGGIWVNIDENLCMHCKLRSYIRTPTSILFSQIHYMYILTVGNRDYFVFVNHNHKQKFLSNPNTLCWFSDDNKLFSVMSFLISDCVLNRNCRDDCDARQIYDCRLFRCYCGGLGA